MHPFLRYFSLCMIMVCLTSCASASLVDSWQGGAPGGRRYHRLLIVGMLMDREQRLACEEKTAAILRRQGVVALTSRELITYEGRPSFQALAEAVEKSGADALLSIHPVGPEPDNGDTWGQWSSLENVSLYPDYWLPELFPRWDLYSHYRNAIFFDSAGQSEVMDFVIQANLFETETKRLIWAGKIELTASQTAAMQDGSVAELILEALVRNGLLSPDSREKSLLAEQQPQPSRRGPAQP